MFAFRLFFTSLCSPFFFLLVRPKKKQNLCHLLPPFNPLHQTRKLTTMSKENISQQKGIEVTNIDMRANRNKQTTHRAPKKRADWI